METKRQVTVKFITGVVLIVISLILGKLVLVPIILFPENGTWRTAMIITYVFSWLLILAGIYLAGMEGFKLATHKYKEYKRKTIHKVQHHGRQAAWNTKRAARKTVRVLRKTRDSMKPRL